MSTQIAPQEPSFSSPKEAKAQAKAEKAYRKANRPWFKKKRFILPLAVVLLLVVVQALNGAGDTTSETATTGTAKVADSAANSAAKPAVKGAGIGAAVRDGKFEFVVTKVERVGKTLKVPFGEETAQGEFLIVRVNVKNIGDEGQTLDTNGQVLFNDKGQKFEPSSAIFSVKDADKFFLQNINPGNKITGAPLLFDVPAGTKISSIELHDSMFSDGIKVKLS